MSRFDFDHQTENVRAFQQQQQNNIKMVGHEQSWLFCLFLVAFPSGISELQFIIVIISKMSVPQTAVLVVAKHKFTDSHTLCYIYLSLHLS